MHPAIGRLQAMSRLGHSEDGPWPSGSKAALPRRGAKRQKIGSRFLAGARCEKTRGWRSLSLRTLPLAPYDPPDPR